MKYKRGDKVDFKDFVTGNKKSGTVSEVSYEVAYWIKVKEGFSYLNTLEVNGRIIKRLNQFSPTIEYWVIEKEIIGLTPEKERDSDRQTR